MPLDRVRTVFSAVAGSPYYSNLYFLNAVGANQAASEIALVKQFWTTLQPTMLTSMPYTVEADVPLIDEATGKITAVHTGVAASGVCTGAGDILPTSAQLLAKLSTNGFVNGRRVRGRIFIPAQLEANNTNGRPAASLLTTLQGALTALIGSAQEMDIWSRPFTHPTDPSKNRVGTKWPVTSGAGWTEWAVQRSRRD